MLRIWTVWQSQPALCISGRHPLDWAGCPGKELSKKTHQLMTALRCTRSRRVDIIHSMRVSSTFLFFCSTSSLKDQVNYKVGTIYHMPLRAQYGIWTIKLCKGHPVRKELIPHKPAGTARSPRRLSMRSGLSLLRKSLAAAWTSCQGKLQGGR